MPTPDTETLAARLRAVERALTDDDAVLDPPKASITGAEPDLETTASGESGPDPDVNDRLCRLEAAVQALHAALEAHDGSSGSGPERTDQSSTDTHRPDATREAATGGPIELPRDPDQDPREPSTSWPDDLAAE
ncbi:hypothetical protein [Haloglomus litoreum]|uniref:hypothetical protein n=1 Tax=Haloglomus litoreum TaxID=3034026 RepID=UPI0023E8C135|nr:hypothetical protein [Haloglomus sp. DT116]